MHLIPATSLSFVSFHGWALVIVCVINLYLGGGLGVGVNLPHLAYSPWRWSLVETHLCRSVSLDVFILCRGLVPTARLSTAAD